MGAQNSGADGTSILNKLRQKHQVAGADGRWFGVDCINCDITDAFANFIWEPTTIKESALNAATEAACLILSIDETVKNPQSEQPGGGMGGGKGKGKGMPGKGMGKGRGRGMRAFRGRG